MEDKKLIELAELLFKTISPVRQKQLRDGFIEIFKKHGGKLDEEHIKVFLSGMAYGRMVKTDNNLIMLIPYKILGEIKNAKNNGKKKNDDKRNK